jgi:hypothetical protein
MKLKVQMVDCPTGRHLAVTDENDVILPNIASVQITSVPNDVDRVVVSFILDDDRVKIIEARPRLDPTDIYDESGGIIGHAA